jgi:hypothetical protein
MPAAHPVIVDMDDTGASREAPSNSNNKNSNRKGKVPPSGRKSAGRVAVKIMLNYATPKSPLLMRLFEQKKKQKKKAPPVGSARDFPCRPCVTRATKSPGHECASQDSKQSFLHVNLPG